MVPRLFVLLLLLLPVLGCRDSPNRFFDNAPVGTPGVVRE
jgi:hypothetical protein